MRNAFTITSMLGTFISLSAVHPALARNFDSVNDCVVGKRVVMNNGQHGKITRIDREWSYCYVLMDDTKKEGSYLYSLLSPEDGNSNDKNNDKLVIGKYNCFVGDQGSGEMRVTGPTTYEAESKKGTYRLEASWKIVFESGTLSTYYAN